MSTELGASGAPFEAVILDADKCVSGVPNDLVQLWDAEYIGAQLRL
jgi:hypothetical protein